MMGNNISLDKTNSIKAFFFDNDSTVFNHSGIGDDILKSTYEGLRKLREKGYKVCMITSRSLAEMNNMPDDFLDLFDDICLLSGGYNITRDKKVEVSPINHDVVLKMINKLDSMDVTYRYAIADGNGFLNRHDKDKEGIFDFLYDMVPDIKKYDNEEVLHMIVYVDKPVSDKIYDYIKDVEYSHVGICAEFSAQGVDKGLTLEKMCKKYGISPEQSCAFGDSGNDISMLSKAGLSICLGNGKDNVKAIADYVTGNIWEDGLYNALKHFNFIE